MIRGALCSLTSHVHQRHVHQLLRTNLSFVDILARKHCFLYVRKRRFSTEADIYEDDDQKLNATRIEKSGRELNITLLKSDLPDMYNLEPREVRILDGRLRNLPTILARPSAIVVNLGQVRAIICADHLVLFNPISPALKFFIVNSLRDESKPSGEGQSDDQSAMPLPKYKWVVERSAPRALPVSPPSSAAASADVRASEAAPSASRRSVAPAKAPFELKCLESLLQGACDALERRYASFNMLLGPCLESATSTEGRTLSEVLPLKLQLGAFSVDTKEVANAISTMLDNDEDMAAMYLTDKAAGQKRTAARHDEVELLLETYLRKVQELDNELRNMANNIDTTEKSIQIRLDSVRNEIMKVELLLAIVTAGVGSGALVTSIFGMNLVSKIEQHPHAFQIASLTAAAIATLLIRSALRLCRSKNIYLLSYPKSTLHVPVGPPGDKPMP